MVSWQAHRLVILGENLQSCGRLISIDYLSFVALKRTLAYEDSLTDSFLVLQLTVQLVQDETALLLVGWLILMTLADQIEGCINDLMSLDSEIAVGLS